jgi:glycosyltransferase involved in cell wall biosynthesis
MTLLSDPADYQISLTESMSQPPLQIVFYSIVPSPYQRDLFYALSLCPEVSIQVYYLEPVSPDAPWQQKQLQPYEKLLPGSCITWGAARFHLNWHLPIARADVIVLNGYLSSISQMILHFRSTQVPCVFWGEKMVAESTGIKGMIQQQFAAGLNQCRAIAAIGSRAEAAYRQRFSDMPVFDIPYYCDLTPFADRPARPRSPITVLFCGQMIERKGVDLLLTAFERIIQQGISARLLLVGREAELPQMMESIAPSTRQHIEYAGFQEPESLPPYFEQADLFVLPSRYDGWGVVVNQALGAGLPIICSDAVGAAQDLVDPSNGAIFPAGDGEALFQALLHYLHDPRSLQSASLASQHKAIAWSPQAGAKRWLEVFKKLADLSD